MKAFFATILLILVTVSCSDSVNDDALRAHELMKKSEAATAGYDFATAEKYFREFKDIQDKYRDTDKYDAFEKAYWKCVAEGKN